MSTKKHYFTEVSVMISFFLKKFV